MGVSSVLLLGLFRGGCMRAATVAGIGVQPFFTRGVMVLPYTHEIVRWHWYRHLFSFFSVPVHRLLIPIVTAITLGHWAKAGARLIGSKEHELGIAGL